MIENTTVLKMETTRLEGALIGFTLSYLLSSSLAMLLLIGCLLPVRTLDDGRSYVRTMVTIIELFGISLVSSSVAGSVMPNRTSKLAHRIFKVKV